MKPSEYRFYFDQIDQAVARRRKLWTEEKDFLVKAKDSIARGRALAADGDAELKRIYEKVTDPVRLKW